MTFQQYTVVSVSELAQIRIAQRVEFWISGHKNTDTQTLSSVQKGRKDIDSRRGLVGIPNPKRKKILKL